MEIIQSLFDTNSFELYETPVLSKSNSASISIHSYASAVVLNLWVATQNWVAGNIPTGREYFIKIT
jgi:hypothetical protein